jgi:hypothetical protein
VASTRDGVPRGQEQVSAVMEYQCGIHCQNRPRLGPERRA